MLEPYAMKVARTVLRRGGASNRVFLVYLLRCEGGVEDGKRNVFIERNPKQEDVMTELESALDAINCIEIESVNFGAGIISSLSNLMCRCDLYARKSCIKKCE